MIFHHAMLHTKLVIISDTFFLISNGHNCVLFLVFDPSTPSYTIHPATEKYERIVAFNWSEIDDIEQPVVYKLTFQMPDSSTCGKITTETNVNFTVTANQTYSVRFLATTCGGAINSTSRLTVNLTGMNIGYKICQSISIVLLIFTNIDTDSWMEEDNCNCTQHNRIQFEWIIVGKYSIVRKEKLSTCSYLGIIPTIVLLLPAYFGVGLYVLNKPKILIWMLYNFAKKKMDEYYTMIRRTASSHGKVYYLSTANAQTLLYFLCSMVQEPLLLLQMVKC